MMFVYQKPDAVVADIAATGDGKIYGEGHLDWSLSEENMKQ